MDLALGRASGPAVVAAAGGGGKTSALFALAEEASRRGLSAALATTTHIRDPRRESLPRTFDALFLDERFADAPAAGADWNPALAPGAIHILASRELPEERKLAGVRPGWIRVFAGCYDVVLVEADGSRGLPVKAPAAHEPVLPPNADVVLGMIGLDCLGRPMDGDTVHRPELFESVAGCPPGAPIEIRHLVALASHPEGLFKGVPSGAVRVMALNKVDLASDEALENLRACFSQAPAGVDAALLCSLARPYSMRRKVPEAPSQLKISPLSMT